MIEFDVKRIYDSRMLVASVRALMSNLISARKDAAVKAHVDNIIKSLFFIYIIVAPQILNLYVIYC